jgi:hypothetical protein
MCRVQGLTYAAFACFAVEYTTLFLGATTFLRGVNALNIVAHGVGVILMILLQVDVSSVVDTQLHGFSAAAATTNDTLTGWHLCFLDRRAGAWMR